MPSPPEREAPTRAARGGPDGRTADENTPPNRWTRRSLLATAAVGAAGLLVGCTEDGPTEVPGDSKNGSNVGSTNNTTRRNPDGTDGIGIENGTTSTTEATDLTTGGQS